MNRDRQKTTWIITTNLSKIPTCQSIPCMCLEISALLQNSSQKMLFLQMNARLKQIYKESVTDTKWKYSEQGPKLSVVNDIRRNNSWTNLLHFVWEVTILNRSFNCSYLTLVKKAYHEIKFSGYSKLIQLHLFIIMMRIEVWNKLNFVWIMRMRSQE